MTSQLIVQDIMWLCKYDTSTWSDIWFLRITDFRGDIRARSCHINDVIMGEIASQITSLTTVYSTVYSDADQRKHQSSASQAFLRGIQRGPLNSPHKWPVLRKMFHLMTSSCKNMTEYKMTNILLLMLWYIQVLDCDHVAPTHLNGFENKTQTFAVIFTNDCHSIWSQC